MQRRTDRRHPQPPHAKHGPDTSGRPNPDPRPYMGRNLVTPKPDVTSLLPNIIQCALSQLLKLKPKKASGPDFILARFLWSMATPRSTDLSFIFQRSLDTGTIPIDWNIANVVPIFKREDRELAFNYRPVSLTAFACKVMEHIVVSNILDHLDSHNILASTQHGLIAKRSCETQLIITTHDLASVLNRHRQEDIAMLDFSEAFDKVPHQHLLHKLSYYGITGYPLSWIESFLSSRTQHVVVDGSSSPQCPVVSSLPQGTVLGPLLFLLFINDIADEIQSPIRLFLDICLLFHEIRFPDDSVQMQRDLDTLHMWSKRWQIAFDTDKCYIMQVTLAKKKIFQHQYTMDGNDLQDHHQYCLHWNDPEQQTTLGLTRQQNSQRI